MKKLTKDLSNFKRFELKNAISIQGGIVMAEDEDNGGPIDPVKKPAGGSTTTTNNDRP